MSDSGNGMAAPRNWVGFALAMMVSGCATDDHSVTIEPGDGYDGITETTVPLLAQPCVINTVAGTMALTVGNGETLYLTVRAADQKVIADGMTGSSAECAVPTTYKISIAPDSGSPGPGKVFLDYINGPFAIGTTTAGVATPGITVDLGAGSSMVVRGSGGVDKMYAGSTYTTGGSPTLVHSWLNINGDTSPDVRFDHVTDLKISTGPGADVISADGANGTTGVSLDSTITFSGYGGPDNDTMTGGKGTNTLDGGDGDDLFVQSATVAADNIVGGKGFDTVDYSIRTAAVSVTVCTTCVLDPSGCAASEATCALGAVNAQTTCNTAASSANATCQSTASTNQATCTSACTVGDTTCTDACDATFASDSAACTATQTTATAACTSTYNAASATCLATELTCQNGATVAACSACLQDDGAAGEGDTVNDDVEIVFGGKGDDTINAAHAVCSNGATTPVVKCTIKGNDGNDTLTGSAFADSIDGGAGDDILMGGQGSDTFIGGAGTDTLSYADRSAAVKVSLDATRLWVAGQQGEVGELDVIGTDIENLTGGAGADFLRGTTGNNIIHGGAGNDTIEGGLGNDALYGEAGNDLIYGGAGNDFLIGGAGADTLVGGDGDDFIDSTDSPATADTVLECDGVNDAAGTAGTAAGTTDSLVKDSSDTGALHCEL